MIFNNNVKPMNFDDEIAMLLSQYPKIATIDADGVMVDYHHGYKKKWESFYKTQLEEVAPGSYYAHTRYGCRQLVGEELKNFLNHNDENFWLGLPALPGAVEAAQKLNEMGFALVCVTAAPHYTREWRHKNLIKHGFPIVSTFTAPHSNVVTPVSAKAHIVNKIKPYFHVDDYLDYFNGMDITVERILLDTHPECPETPNNGPARVDCKVHSNLKDFVDTFSKVV